MKQDGSSKSAPVAATREVKRHATPSEREAMWQMYLVCGNKREVARTFGFSEMGVRKILKRMSREDADLKAARKAAAVNLAGKVHLTANKIIDSIKDEDLVSGRIAVRDSKGEIAGYREYGPSLMQKITASAIAIDKLKVLREHEAALGQDTQNGSLPVPEDLQSLVRGLQSKVKSLSILNVQFDNDTQGTLDQAQEIIQEAEVALAEGPKEISLDDFDATPDKQ